MTHPSTPAAVVATEYAAGDACPDCGKPMIFDKGEDMSRDSPGEAPCVFCADCGICHPVDWSRAIGDTAHQEPSA